MTEDEYKKMLAESGGVTDPANKKSVENPPQLDKKDEEILDKAWKSASKSKSRSRKPIAA
jgi:hypothetical protein